MPRVKIGLALLVAITALTAATYFVATGRLETRLEADVRARVALSAHQFVQNASFEALGIMKRAEELARDARLIQALDTPEVVERAKIADPAFQEFRTRRAQDEPEPDSIVLVNAQGQVAAMLEVPRPEAEDWKTMYPAVAAALTQGTVAKDVWDYRGRMMKVGVAPVYERASGAVKGAVVIEYALNAAEAQGQAALLGMDVGFFFGDRVHATSFRTDGSQEDASKQQALERPLKGMGLTKAALVEGRTQVGHVQIGGEDYLATAARMPLNYADKTSGAVMLGSLSDALAPLASIKLVIVLLGLGAALVAFLAMLLSARMILNPVEKIEAGVTEIINGNIDYTFAPAGADLDGLANALNVMLARLLGRPEPGEEEVDEEGNVRERGQVTFDVEGGAEALGGPVATDAEAVALANEPEPDYYRRIFGEFVAARRSVGGGDGVSFEEFVAKLRLSEVNLRQKYNCRAVRFRVQIAGGQVTLKPVPIV